MKIYLYCRVSTPRQNIERQVRRLTALYPTGIVVKEVYTRTKFQGRKEWDKIMRVIQPGDMIVFESVSRMCGNEEEGCQIYEELFNKGIELIFDNEPHVNTEVYRKKRDLFLEIFDEVGISCYPSEGAFYLVPEVPNSLSTEEFIQSCKEEGLLLVDAAGFGLDRNVRISYAVPEDKILLAREKLRKIMDKL